MTANDVKLPSFQTGIKSCSGRQDSGPVVQRLEQWTHNPLVVGSNPSGPIINSLICKALRFTIPLGVGTKKPQSCEQAISPLTFFCGIYQICD